MKTKNKLGTLLLAGLAIAGIGAVADPAPQSAEAVTYYSFTTYCGSSKNPKIFVSAPSYVYTNLQYSYSGTTVRSGYGSWSYQGPDTTYRYYYANGKPSVSYVCL
jgi:hypothetical protein